MKLRFSLRTLMIGVTLFCVALGLGIPASKHLAFFVNHQPQLPESNPLYRMAGTYAELSWDNFIIFDYRSSETLVVPDDVVRQHGLPVAMVKRWTRSYSFWHEGLPNPVANAVSVPLNAQIITSTTEPLSTPE